MAELYSVFFNRKSFSFALLCFKCMGSKLPKVDHVNSHWMKGVWPSCNEIRTFWVVHDTVDYFLTNITKTSGQWGVTTYIVDTAQGTIMCVCCADKNRYLLPPSNLCHICATGSGLFRTKFSWANRLVLAEVVRSICLYICKRPA